VVLVSRAAVEAVLAVTDTGVQEAHHLALVELVVMALYPILLDQPFTTAVEVVEVQEQLGAQVVMAVGVMAQAGQVRELLEPLIKAGAAAGHQIVALLKREQMAALA
jgi:hypothetical protein